MSKKTKSGEAKELTSSLLRRWSLPQPDEGGDKEERGRVLVVGGAPEMPGALILAATAALRAGAGKLQMATCASVRANIACAVPEALAVALPETKRGGIAASGANLIAENIKRADAILVGPGMVDKAATSEFIANLLPKVGDKTCVILDAAALEFLKRAPDGLHNLKGACIITPRAGEMASLTGAEKKEIEREPLKFAREAAKNLNAVVALKGAETFIVAPSGEAFCNRHGNVGLATSGSGDTLSGVIAGLAARGATPLQAAAWGVFLHAKAGERLAAKMNLLGYLARELLAEIPHVMRSSENPKKTKRRKPSKR